MLDLIVKGLVASGPIGAILAYFLWQNHTLTKKLFNVIESNTEAITINNQQLTELVTAQNKRRETFRNPA